MSLWPARNMYGMPRAQASAAPSHEILTYLELEDARYRPLEEYSTGMKQRIKLAQALVHDPPVLLLDEPTSGLDPSGRDAMLRLLLALGKDHGKSFILCTHLLGDVERVCETVLILHEGRILQQGPVSTLRQRRQHRYRLRIEGDATAFREELESEGVTLVRDHGRGELRVAVPAGWVTRAFFVLADNHGVLLRGLRPDDESLEELFQRSLSETNGHNPPSPLAPVVRGRRRPRGESRIGGFPHGRADSHERGRPNCCTTAPGPARSTVRGRACGRSRASPWACSSAAGCSGCSTR